MTLDINCRSSSRITTKKSLYFYNQWMKLPKYQELILTMNHVIANDLPYIKLSKIKTNTINRRNYMAERKRTEQFLTTAGVSNEVRHLHHLHDPHIAGIYGPLNNKVIQDNTLPTINKAFVHNPTHPLLASSNNIIDLIYIPTIYNDCYSWNQYLFDKE